MHKTKQDTAKPSKSPDQDTPEVEETANDEAYEAIDGETSTEGIGRGYDADGPDASPTETAESSADGPLSGELSDPPTESPQKRIVNKRQFDAQVIGAITLLQTTSNQFNQSKELKTPRGTCFA